MRSSEYKKKLEDLLKKGFIVFGISGVIGLVIQPVWGITKIAGIFIFLLATVGDLFGFFFGVSENIYDFYKEYKEEYKKTYQYQADTEEENDYKYYNYKENKDKEIPDVDEKYKSYLDYMGLSNQATKKEIKQKYRKMAKIYHPDKISNSSKDAINQATKNMQELNAAYAYLMNKI